MGRILADLTAYTLRLQRPFVGVVTWQVEKKLSSEKKQVKKVSYLHRDENSSYPQEVILTLIYYPRPNVMPYGTI